MFKAILAFAALAVAGAALPGAAQAQDYGYRSFDGPPPPPPGYYGDRPPPPPPGYYGDRPFRGPLSPRGIYRKLRSQGFSNIEIVNQRRDVYIVRAQSRRGWDVVLVVDAFSGDVVRQRPADDGGRGPRDGWDGGGHRW